MKRGRILKSVVGAALAVLLAFSVWVPAFAAPPSVSSDYYILMDAATGQVLLEKNSDAQLPPGGLIKILTALVAAENITDDTSKLTVTSSALTPLGTGVKSIGLTAGELISIADCMYAMLMTSANDAANVVAESVGTSLDGFMTMLGNRAVELGADKTALKNPNGLHADGQVSSPRDIALFSRAALANEAFMKYFGKVSYTLEPTNNRAEAKPLTTSFLMLRDSDYHYDGILGGMVGFTSASKYVIMATAERDGRQLIAVVMKAETEAEMYQDAAKILDYGFSDFVSVTVPNDLVLFTANLAENGVKVGTVEFRMKTPVSILLRSDYDVSKIVASPNSIPTVLNVGAEQEYTADIIYRPNADDPAQDVRLLSGVTLSADTKTDGAAQTTDPNGTGPVETDESGNPVTTSGEPSGGFLKGVGKFFKVFFTILLIIIAVVVGLALLFIAALFIIREVKRRKRRKARERARQRTYQDSDRQ
ncbi:MAG: hypothetical protein DBY36_07680 [Clostridiales bacterium]|nr:MAG: hypothetical protein DBY36_07680 [Clostridiales bacterium]